MAEVIPMRERSNKPRQLHSRAVPITTPRITSATVWRHTKLVATAASVVLVAIMIMLQPVPMKPSRGSIGLLDAKGNIKIGVPIKSGDDVGVSWDQKWIRLCPIKITPVIVDGSGSPRKFEDATGKEAMIVTPPNVASEFRNVPRVFKMPPVVGPTGEYFSIIKPMCWYDRFIDRTYVSEKLSFAIVHK